MDQKLTRNQRRKLAREAAAAAQPAKLSPVAALRQRRTRRLLLIGVVVVLLPLLELVAYRFRSILIVVANRSDEPVTDVRVTYPGGSFEAKELKPGGEVTHVARPDFSFTRENFSTYLTNIRLTTSRGDIIRLQGNRAGTIDYSAREIYSLQPDPVLKTIGIQHTTQAGFPLSVIRDLMAKFGR